jgi:DNA-binding GntR family transcriptional regulator
MSTPRNRASDVAYQTLKTRIIRGEFTFGQPLNLVDLQNRLGVGRTPMREALQRLVEDGLVNMIPTRGTFVNQVSLTELKLLMEARMELEGACARMVALSPEPKILVQLEQLVDNPGAFIPPDDHRDPAYALDEIFHPLFYAATGNPFIQTALLRLFYNATLSASVLRIPRFSCQAIQDDFHQILCAVRAKDPDAAAEIMRHHIGTFRHRIAEQFLGPGTTRSLEGGESPG